MKKVLSLLMSCSLLFMGCRHDDVLENDPNQSHKETGLKGKSFVLTQTELEAKYPGNKSLNNILQKEFKTEGGLIKTNSEDEAQNGVYIDLDNIRVFESDQMHAITYYVEIGEQQETDEPQEVYNLMYFSKDYENYHVILFKYDFSQIPFQQFVANPESIINVLGFVPLNDIENIYENISYSISHGLNSTSAVQTTSTSPVLFTEFINLADCIGEVTYPAQPCKDVNHHPYGDTRCPHRGTDMGATPPRTYLDFSKCGKSGGTPGGGTPGSGGGPGGSPSVGNPGGGIGGNPGWSNPIKFPVDIIDIGIIVGEINIYKINNNHKTLKAIRNSTVIRADLIDFYSKLDQTIEHGKAYGFKTVNKSYLYDSNWPLANPVLQDGKISLVTANAKYNGVIHTHPTKVGNPSVKLAPLFSMADLAAIFKFANETAASPNRKPAEAFIGAVNKYGLYMAMLPNNVDKTNMATRYADFTKTLNGKVVADTEKQKWTDIEKELSREYSTIENSSATEAQKKKAHEKVLLQVMKEYGLEMNIYFLNQNSGTFNGTWQQVTLNNSGQVEYININ